MVSGEHTFSLELSCLPDNILFSRAVTTEEISKSKGKSMDVGYIRLIEEKKKLSLQRYFCFRLYRFEFISEQI